MQTVITSNLGLKHELLAFWCNTVHSSGRNTY